MRLAQSSGFRCGGALLAGSALVLPWQVRVIPVCSSTETLLTAWLQQEPRLPVAVVAKKQRFGRGSANRSWQSPSGGLWLSAAIPWFGESPQAENLPILMAAALEAELQSLGIGPQLQIKAPNDLIVGNQKLAGVLTSVVWRGLLVRHVRFGIGLNGRHPIRPPGITLEQLLGNRCPPWQQLVLLGLRAVEKLASNVSH